MTMIQVLGLLNPASAPRPPRKTASDGGGQVNHHSSYYRILIKRIELISVKSREAHLVEFKIWLFINYLN